MGIEYLGFSPDRYPKHRPCSGKLLIAGSARCVWEDISTISVNNYEIMALNDMIMHFPGPLKHAYSNDVKMLANWIKARRTRYVMDWGQTNAHSCHGGWPWPGHGTSSLNAIYTGLALGYDEILLAGVPLDDSGHYWEAPWLRSNFTKEVSNRDGEIRFWANAARNVFDGKVKSLSGRTKELLNGT
jgi:hypothetical protein